MSTCHSNGTEHCCWIGGVACPHLGENIVMGRRWACTLLVEYGSWGAVYESVEYQATAAAAFFTENHPGKGCGDWPQNIPEVMAEGIGLCCWNTEVSLGNLGT